MRVTSLLRSISCARFKLPSETTHWFALIACIIRLVWKAEIIPAAKAASRLPPRREQCFPSHKPTLIGPES